MNTSIFKQELLALLREAGKILLSAHEVESENAVSDKAGTANFVTVYDVRVQNFLINALTDLFPDAQFLAEEKENDASVLESEICFVIDPIDATTNFIHDYHHSCISLALISRGAPVFGAVYDPYLDEMFCAEAGKGAELNGVPIRVSHRPIEIGVAAYGTSPYYKDRLTKATFDLSRDVFLACADLRRCGSAALDLAYLAAGRNDLFFECILAPWDYAAGILLVKEAGGLVSDMKGEPLSLAHPCSIIAANPTIYPKLLEIVKPYTSDL